MNDRTTLWLGALLIIAVLAHSVWRYHTARAIAEDWLRRHRYRARALRMSWFALPRFAPKFFRDEGRAYQFRAEVDDLRLGGTGILWLRVWTDWYGLMQREPEVNWERMPVDLDERSRTMEDKLLELQLSLLGRVADGETTFRMRTGATDMSTDAVNVVEHVMALARRGLVTCDAPLLSGRGEAQVAAVTNVAVTDDGRRLLGAQRRP